MYPHIHVFGTELSLFSLLIASGLNFSLFATVIVNKLYGSLTQKQVIVFWTIIVLTSFVSGRIGQFLLYDNNLSLEGGSSILGMITASIPVVYIYSILARQRWTELADLTAFGILCVQLFGKVGCLLAGCCYGIEGDSILCIRTNLNQIPNGRLVYPVQLIEELVFLMLFISLSYLWRRRVQRGTIAVVYLLVYGVERFMVEFIRGDTTSGVLGLTAGQEMSVLFIAISISLMTIIKFKMNYAPESKAA